MISNLPLSSSARDSFMKAAIAEAAQRIKMRRMSSPKFELRGANLAIQTINDTEQVITHGPAGTGKSLGWLTKINRLMWKHPNLRVLFIRAVRADLAESILVTYERDILGYTNPICDGAARQNRSAYHYPNGSMIALGGMDRPGRFLSSEWDIIYVAECNQISKEHWNMLWSRLARDGAYPTPQIIGDTNPDRPDHWIQKQAKDGKLKLLPTTHQDNPKYWSDGNWTPLGRQYVLGRLAGLDGILRKKFFEGLWVVAEGAVYDTFSVDIHIKNDQELIAMGWLKRSDPDDEDSPVIAGDRVVRVIGGQDWGYTNPGDLEVWLMDSDGRMLLVHEVYMTQQLIGWWVGKAQAANAHWGIEVLACDPSQPAFIQEMRNGGINALPAVNDILDGVQRVQTRLRVAGDGEPRLLIRAAALDERDPARSEKFEPCGLSEEITGLIWADKGKKEMPAANANDHACDVVRYVAQEADLNRRIDTTVEAFSL